MTMADPNGDPGQPGGDARFEGASTTEPFEGAGGPPAQPVSDEEARGVAPTDEPGDRADDHGS